MPTPPLRLIYHISIWKVDPALFGWMREEHFAIYKYDDEACVVYNLCGRIRMWSIWFWMVVNHRWRLFLLCRNPFAVFKINFVDAYCAENMLRKLLRFVSLIQ
jgi:hypothetical protein